MRRISLVETLAHMRHRRAVVALLLASITPGLVSLLLGLDQLASADLVEIMLWFAIWVLFALPMVFLVGYPALYVAERFPPARVLLPPLLGTAAGLAINWSFHRSWLEGDPLFFVICSVATACVGSAAYFLPTRKAPK